MLKTIKQCADGSTRLIVALNPEEIVRLRLSTEPLIIEVSEAIPVFGRKITMNITTNPVQFAKSLDE